MNRRSLLDVNVLIALLDANHVSHIAAREWFAANAVHGWASCAITQNGCLRIMSHPSYPNVQPVAEVARRLRVAASQPVHEFWTDSLSILDPERVDHSRLHGAKQITDTYLLALAVSNNGRLITFDRSVAASAVRGASELDLVVL